VTAVLDAPPHEATAVGTPDGRPASWQARAAAIALDVLPGVAVAATMALCAFTALETGWLFWVFTVAGAAAVLATMANRWLLPATTGWSVGRAVAGIRVVRRNGTAAGVWRLLVRDLAHLLDTAALLVGWLWPLWDGRNRTFADLLTGTEVRVSDRPERDVRRTAGKVLLAAVVVCALAVGLSYLVVYRQERAVDQAHQQIAEQGPRIVEQMLSYSLDTMADDFARAQGLATDSYRAQLTEQQDAAKKSGASTNEYWAVSSAVLPGVTKDRAAMLLAMQGQRGTDPKDLKFITATLRVDFEKSGGQWRVSNLAVLKRPLINGATQ
jgi:Mce-associated membrane protein